MNKKYLLVFLGLLTVLSFAACKDNGDEAVVIPPPDLSIKAGLANGPCKASGECDTGLICDKAKKCVGSPVCQSDDDCKKLGDHFNCGQPNIKSDGSSERLCITAGALQCEKNEDCPKDGVCYEVISAEATVKRCGYTCDPPCLATQYCSEKLVCGSYASSGPNEDPTASPGVEEGSLGCKTDADCAAVDGQVCVEGACASATPANVPPPAQGGSNSIETACSPACGEGQACIDKSCVPKMGQLTTKTVHKTLLPNAANKKPLLSYETYELTVTWDKIQIGGVDVNEYYLKINNGDPVLVKDLTYNLDLQIKLYSGIKSYIISVWPKIANLKDEDIQAISTMKKITLTSQPISNEKTKVDLKKKDLVGPAPKKP